ncbi:hypothetical protein EXN66_Car007885 [Channa argus]|uniref:Uncharacterized protein n=1 Tax=Channa argus TaxID=215402 RepID=A0A6G1PPR0_CHAAH|nr:hypothetical protein EXN66_Car007885 [Channa argus]
MAKTKQRRTSPRLALKPKPAPVEAKKKAAAKKAPKAKKAKPAENGNTKAEPLHNKTLLRSVRPRRGLVNQPSFSSVSKPPHTSVDMIIRLGRLTPGYFRLLQVTALPQQLKFNPTGSSEQRQVAGEVQMQSQDRAVNQIAMMLAIIGLSMSYYSAKQMTEKVQAQPAP